MADQAGARAFWPAPLRSASSAKAETKALACSDAPGQVSMAMDPRRERSEEVVLLALAPPLAPLLAPGPGPGPVPVLIMVLVVVLDRRRGAAAGSGLAVRATLGNECRREKCEEVGRR